MVDQDLLNAMRASVSVDLEAIKEMNRRHAALDSQLATRKLYAHDVSADGNCLFRAACYAANGDDSKHAELHASVVKSVKENKLNLCTLFGLDNKTFHSLIMDLRKPGISVGELAVYCLPDVLHRDVVLYMTFSEPQTFLSILSNNIRNPIHLAFYDGLRGGTGHYKAIDRSVSLSTNTKTGLTVHPKLCPIRYPSSTLSAGNNNISQTAAASVNVQRR